MKFRNYIGIFLPNSTLKRFNFKIEYSKKTLKLLKIELRHQKEIENRLKAPKRNWKKNSGAKKLKIEFKY